MPRFALFAAFALATLLPALTVSAAETEYDILVYGGTAGGAVAAVQAARLGKTALLIEPRQHIGGLTSGGLGATDIGNKVVIGGLAREFYHRVALYYARPEAWKQETRDEYNKKGHRGIEDTMWTFEPHAAEEILRAMLAEAKVPVVFGERLDLKHGVKKDAARITSITMESGQTYRAKVFIDATYEGDLLAKAGCSYTVGRESNSQYGETLDGVQLGSRSHQFNRPVDPYIKPGDPASGLLPGIHPGGPGEQGQGDKRVQAYNFRMCMTDDPGNRLAWPQPEGYDPLRYELLLRYIKTGTFDVLGNNQPMPNRKTDTNNNGGFATDNIGMNYDYPDGDYATRERIWNEHVTYQQGLMYFLANDPRLPEKVRAEISRWGLSKDEFADTGHWPHQLYVREARRMISDYVMTEHNCRGHELAPDSVGMGAYGMDSHNTQRYVKDGYASNEGDVQVHGFAPYPIAYKSIVPKAAECTNLLVPVCLSATHIAYGSIRMEPVFMVLGQSSATAAAMAIDAGVPVQQVDTKQLRERLLADKQVLDWKGPKSQAGIDPRKLPGIVVDDRQAKLVGDWPSSTSMPFYVGVAYAHDKFAKNQPAEHKEARFELPVTTAGRYEVRIAYTALPNRATNVPVTITTADGVQTVHVNQRQTPAIDKLWQPLGTWRFAAGQPAVVVFTNDNCDGYVIIDAVQLLPAK